ncbi:MAG TPA: hypothetical protein VHN37_11340 [Actinomycetota bacterium]|nr:hypothetical protein [Actinomycetota bacterium]
MKRLRVFLAGVAVASAFVVAGPASPASASCYGEPVNACRVVCAIGLGNKYTAPAFQWCYIT